MSEFWFKEDATLSKNPNIHILNMALSNPGPRMSLRRVQIARKKFIDLVYTAIEDIYSIENIDISFSTQYYPKGLLNEALKYASAKSTFLCLPAETRTRLYFDAKSRSIIVNTNHNEILFKKCIDYY